MACKRCGKCCQRVLIDTDIRGISMGNMTDYSLYLRSHGIKVGVGKEALNLEIPLTCKHLRTSTEGCQCAIYDSRPEVCRNFSCS